ncbi:hypothetical protein MNB_SM-3-41 [hydrothermal vent metagenome]|uniref:Uncharacterized protein n=1 Tax=hydrothermal vent metagenome TaxID=652676 RepID=A0A1W1D4Z5_9ZZZZ
MITFVSLTPMIFVQIYGIVVYNLIDQTTPMLPQIIETVEVSKDSSIFSIFRNFLSIFDTFLVQCGNRCGMMV